MGTGPDVKGHYDLSLTEIIDEKQHFFLIDAGSPNGEKVLEKVQHRPAEASEVSMGEDVVRNATSGMKRTLDTRGIKELLYKNAEDPEWEKVGARCLSCTNCTMVCPTCFCNTVEDSTDLEGTQATRTRKWDSCFTLDFSYIHGGNIRTSTKARYRQWMTHKLASWIDQFGTSGCVGCGRCITWCPVGIDITDEARVIRENSVVHERSQA
jgi:ferredoxin